MTESKINEFTNLVHATINDAVKMFGITAFDASSVIILYDLRGVCAARAGLRCGYFFLRFNLEAMTKDWDHMTNSTIAHEIAHLVCYAHCFLGKNHNKGWKEVAIALGSTGERCHSIDLTPARRTVKFKYVMDDGTTVAVGSKRHNRIQDSKGGDSGFYIMQRSTKSGRKMLMNAEHYCAA